MVEHQLPKLNTRVRFPSPAPPQLSSPERSGPRSPARSDTRAFAASAACPEPRNGPSVTRCQVPSAVFVVWMLDSNPPRASSKRAAGPPPSSPGTSPPGRGTRGGREGRASGAGRLRGYRPARRAGLPSARAARRRSRRQDPNRRPEPPTCGEGVGRSRSSSSAARSGLASSAGSSSVSAEPVRKPRVVELHSGRDREPEDETAEKAPPCARRPERAVPSRHLRPPYMVAGALTPRSPSPSATTRRVASARVSRALLRSGSPARMVWAL